jgi:hypothetical protein
MAQVCAQEAFFDSALSTSELPESGSRLLETELSIAEVRKALSHLRKGWEEVQLDPKSKPLYLSSTLSLSATHQVRMESFALHFVLAHHQKRHNGTAAAAETEKR